MRIDYWAWQSFVGVLIISATFLWRIRHTPLWIVAPWGYFVLHAVWSAFSPLATFPIDFKDALSFSAAQSLVLLIFLPLLLLSKDSSPIFTTWIKRIITGIAICDAIYIVAGGQGIFTGRTFDACIIVLLLNIERRWFDVFPLLVVLVTHSVGALLLWVLSTVPRYKFDKKMLAIIAVIAATSYYFANHGLTDSNGRVQMWLHFFHWWVLNANWLFGTGAGSFEYLGLFLPSGQKETWFFIMHNDWLQILFEFGIIGFAMAACLYIGVLKYCTRQRKFFILTGLCMCFYSPLHIVLIQILGLIYLNEDLYGKGTSPT